MNIFPSTESNIMYSKKIPLRRNESDRDHSGGGLDNDIAFSRR